LTDAQEKRPSRVFMTADAVGGVWHYVVDLAGGLRSYGVETIVAVMGPPPSKAQRAKAAAAGISLVETGLPLDWMAANAAEVEEAGCAIGRLAARFSPDVVHLNSPALAATGAFPCVVVAVAHSCVATWWRTMRAAPMPADFAWQFDLVGRGYRAADAILAPTASFAELTALTYGLSAAPLVVRNGRARSAAAWRSSEASVVFTAGRLWDEGKNVAALDRAAANLGIPVLAAGPVQGPNGTRVEFSHLRLLGVLDGADIARQLAARPIFVSTARYEPFGLAVLEAAQAGCALILSDIPTFRELWDGAAVFVSPCDDVAVASAVEHLWRDHDFRAGLGRTARERSEVYSAAAMCAGVWSIYRSLVSRKDPRDVGAAA
jgi:glycosyltransferase involved in cell wall biosynthesis